MGLRIWLISKLGGHVCLVKPWVLRQSDFMFASTTLINSSSSWVAQLIWKRKEEGVEAIKKRIKKRLGGGGDIDGNGKDRTGMYLVLVLGVGGWGCVGSAGGCV